MSPGLREAKRAAMEQRLAAIAFDLVRERGFAEVTVDDIVQEAVVSRRTFSNYYACKEAAVAAVVGHRARAALDSWVPPDGADVLEVVGHLVDHQVERGTLEVLRQVAGLAVAHPQLRPYVHEAQWQVWEGVGERARAATGARDAGRAEMVDLVVGALFGLVSARLGADGPAGTEAAGDAASVHDRVRGALGRLRAGLGDPAG